MSDLPLQPSQITIDNDNGSNTTFNFNLPNGLPVKPIIECEYEEGYSKEQNFYALSIFLTEEDSIKLSNFTISSYYIFKNELWLLIKNNYLVFLIQNDKIITEAKNKKLIFYFFNKDKKFLRGVDVGH